MCPQSVTRPDMWGQSTMSEHFPCQVGTLFMLGRNTFHVRSEHITYWNTLHIGTLICQVGPLCMLEHFTCQNIVMSGRSTILEHFVCQVGTLCMLAHCACQTIFMSRWSTMSEHFSCHVRTHYISEHFAYWSIDLPGWNTMSEHFACWNTFHVGTLSC